MPEQQGLADPREILLCCFVSMEAATEVAGSQKIWAAVVSSPLSILQTVLQMSGTQSVNHISVPTSECKVVEIRKLKLFIQQ